MKIFRLFGFATLAASAAVFIFLPTSMRGQNAAPVAKSSAAPAKGNAENGKLLFVKFGCYECHGREAQGASYTGPRLGPDVFPFAVLTTYVRKPTGEMPPYTTKVVSDEELADIYAFLQSRPHPPAAKDIPLPK